MRPYRSYFGFGWVLACEQFGEMVDVVCLNVGQRSQAYRWRLGRGIEYLADPPGAVIFSWAVGVSADGTIVAGHVVVWEGNREVWYLAHWFADGGVEIIPGSRELAMRALSGDGRVIVGTDFNYYIPSGFRWVEGRGVEHPFLGSPRDLSYDGWIVVGQVGVSVGRRTRLRAVGVGAV